MRSTLSLVAVLALVAAACGGSAGADEGVASIDDSVPLQAASDGDEADLTDEEALFAFTACLRDLGIEIEDPTVDADGNVRLQRPSGGGDGGPAVDRDTVRAECGQLLDGVSLGFRDRDRTEVEDQLLAFAVCMRHNGYDMPDPDFSAAGPGSGGPFGQIDRSDPEFLAAAESCQDILTGFGRGPGGPGAGGGRGEG